MWGLTWRNGSVGAPYRCVCAEKKKGSRLSRRVRGGVELVVETDTYPFLILSPSPTGAVLAKIPAVRRVISTVDISQSINELFYEKADQWGARFKAAK